MLMTHRVTMTIFLVNMPDWNQNVAYNVKNYKVQFFGHVQFSVDIMALFLIICCFYHRYADETQRYLLFNYNNFMKLYGQFRTAVGHEFKMVENILPYWLCWNVYFYFEAMLYWQLLDRTQLYKYIFWMHWAKIKFCSSSVICPVNFFSGSK